MNRQELLSEGYQEQAPSHEAAVTDKELCQQDECSICGHEGLTYTPFSKPGSYRPFGICPSCGHAEEF